MQSVFPVSTCGRHHHTRYCCTYKKNSWLATQCLSQPHSKEVMQACRRKLLLAYGCRISVIKSNTNKENVVSCLFSPHFKLFTPTIIILYRIETYFKRRFLTPYAFFAMQAVNLSQRYILIWASRKVRCYVRRIQAELYVPKCLLQTVNIKSKIFGNRNADGHSPPDITTWVYAKNASSCANEDR
jgi:hypothetical protein